MYFLGYLWKKRCKCGSGSRVVYMYAFHNGPHVSFDVTEWQLIISTHFVPIDVLRAGAGGLSLQRIANYFTYKNIAQLKISGGVHKLVGLSTNLTKYKGWTRL